MALAGLGERRAGLDPEEGDRRIEQGGPAGATETLVYKITQNQNPRLVSTGSAMSIGLFGVTLVITAMQFVLLNKRVHYDS